MTAWNRICRDARRYALAVLVLAATGCSPGCGTRPTPQQGGKDTPLASQEPGEPGSAGRRTIDIFAFGRVLGAISPCGCTSDPLGGLAFMRGMLSARSLPSSRLVLEPGSFLFPDPDGPETVRGTAAWAQALKKATVLHGSFASLAPNLVAGLGPTDLSSPGGASAVSQWPLPRVLGNLDPGAAGQWPGLQPSRTVNIEGYAVAVTSIVDPAAVPPGAGFPALRDPLSAARDVARSFEQSAADLRVILVHGPRALAERIARQVTNIDLIIVGGVLREAERGRTGGSPARIGGAWLVEPGDRMQTVSHIKLSISRAQPRPLTATADWVVVPSPAALRAQVERVTEQLTKFRSAADADPTFLARLERELEHLNLQIAGGRVPDSPVRVTFEQVKIRCTFTADPEAETALSDYDAWVATENEAKFSGVQAPDPAPGQPSYAGTEACSNCHDEAETFWADTRHASAYATLVKANKQYDLSCVGCHVTGFREPGGAEVVENEGLRDVQCEQCHGPGSLHADDPVDSKDRAWKINLHAPAELCLSCHTPEHSDTFDYAAYLRDVLGPGHGARARQALGAGATGRELRAAAVQKAGGGCSNAPH
ncbi:MAG: multiheme c-type cytochrome [Nannocystaceae bacterium]